MAAGERNLSNIVEKERIAGLDWDKIRAIAGQVAGAVGHMHSRGYIHGDLKRELVNQLLANNQCPFCHFHVDLMSRAYPIFPHHAL
jgi:tRNA A-37 threonylcarbamoyl transferase component Bud32